MDLPRIIGALINPVEIAVLVAVVVGVAVVALVDPQVGSEGKVRFTGVAVTDADEAAMGLMVVVVDDDLILPPLPTFELSSCNEPPRINANPRNAAGDSSTSRFGATAAAFRTGDRSSPQVTPAVFK